MRNIERKRVLSTLVNENDKIDEAGGKEETKFYFICLGGDRTV